MKTRIGISIVCMILVLGHVVFPGVEIDLVTVVLLMLGIVPWLAPVIKSLELPGGFKIELQDVKSATEKVAGPELAALPAPEDAEARRHVAEEADSSLPRQVGEHDPNLALVGLRIEVEKRLAQMAKAAGIHVTRRSASWLLRELQARSVLPAEIASGLNELIALGNRAAHGADVSADAAAWVLKMAPDMLAVLEVSVIPLEKRKEHRLRLLHALYEETEGDEHAFVKLWDLGREVGLSEDETTLAYQYLRGEGLLEARAMGGVVSITHWGVKQVEAALESPSEQTQYFPPAINVIQIERAINSPIQQASAGASQIVSIRAEHLESLHGFLDRLDAVLPDLELPETDSREIQAQAATVRGQLQSAEPDRTVVSTAMDRLRGVLEGAAAAGTAEFVRMLLSLIPPL
jgi:hypothetical protein